MANIRLDSMTNDEFMAYYSDAITSYAEMHVSSGSWPAEGALERAANEHAALLPNGLATPGHHLYTARDGDNRVGMLWFAEQAFGNGQIAYVFNVEIDKELRGNGYGKAIIQALEAEVRTVGLDNIQLHVHGNNQVARSLYTKLGYIETNVIMSKLLDKLDGDGDKAGPVGG